MTGSPAQNLLHAGLDAFAILGGATAGVSGFLAAVCLVFGIDRRTTTAALESGIAIAGLWGVPAAVAVFLAEVAGWIG